MPWSWALVLREKLWTFSLLCYVWKQALNILPKCSHRMRELGVCETLYHFVLLRVILSGVFVRFNFFFKFENIQTSLMVQWVRLCFHYKGHRFTPLSQELRSHKLYSTDKKREIKISESVHATWHACQAFRSSISTCLLAEWVFKTTHSKITFILPNSKLYLLWHWCFLFNYL